MRFRVIISYPFFMDKGGGRSYARDLFEALRRNGHEAQILDWTADGIDFDTLIVIGSSLINPEIVSFVRSKQIPILVVSIYDRMHSKVSVKLSELILRNMPFQTTRKIRRTILDSAKRVYALSAAEKEDLTGLLGVDSSKVAVRKLGIPYETFDILHSTGPEIFTESYGIENFVICPAASISSRKNQLNLLRALRDTDYRVVFTGTTNVETILCDEWEKLTKGNANVLCLGLLEKRMLVSALKAAKVYVSLSRAETAGIANIEAGAVGLPLVVSDIPPHREYLGDYALYCDQENPKNILKVIEKALETKTDHKLVSAHFVSEYSWDSYADAIVTEVSTILASR